ncbi:MAG: hypothetical protein DBP02_07635 [gamma proteobacterium symbiont of Ctena orbiculata]|nr:MAG: hypothetical protein DBP02_07635 [gamma proteobacterium symbiont of Ctena orbiculata]
MIEVSRNSPFLRERNLFSVYAAPCGIRKLKKPAIACLTFPGFVQAIFPPPFPENPPLIRRLTHLHLYSSTYDASGQQASLPEEEMAQVMLGPEW